MEAGTMDGIDEDRVMTAPTAAASPLDTEEEDEENEEDEVDEEDEEDTFNADAELPMSMPMRKFVSEPLQVSSWSARCMLLTARAALPCALMCKLIALPRALFSAALRGVPQDPTTPSALPPCLLRIEEAAGRSQPAPHAAQSGRLQNTGGGQRRGSVVNFGGRQASISVDSELDMTTSRLRKASVSGDLGTMQAALAAAANFQFEQGQKADEMRGEAMKLASQMSNDTELSETAKLKRNPDIKVRSRPPPSTECRQEVAAPTHSNPFRSVLQAKIRKFWDLMVAISASDAEESGTEIELGAVSRSGYRMMHACFTKALDHEFNIKEAAALADSDWAQVRASCVCR